MKSMIAILTYRRLPVLKEMLRGIKLHCPDVPLRIFEDCGQRDGTEAFLMNGCEATQRPDLLAVEYTPVSMEPSAQEAALGLKPDRYHSFLGTHNLGVAGNSNRALKVFMESDCDHLLLCNDDLHVLGDFPATYAEAHEDLEVGFFCFTDFNYNSSYATVPVRSRGYKLKLMQRFTGIMMSMTRQVVEDIGYFDSRFGKFGEEHCDYTIRARQAGHISLDGAMQNCLDLDPDVPVLKHQDAQTSVSGPERVMADREASEVMSRVAAEYQSRNPYREFRLRHLDKVGSRGGAVGGIDAVNLENYAIAGTAAE